MGAERDRLADSHVIFHCELCSGPDWRLAGLWVLNGAEGKQPSHPCHLQPIQGAVAQVDAGLWVLNMAKGNNPPTQVIFIPFRARWRRWMLACGC